MSIFIFSGILLAVTSVLTGFFVIIQDHQKPATRWWSLFCLSNIFIGLIIYNNYSLLNDNIPLIYYNILIFFLALNGIILFYFINSLLLIKNSKLLISFVIGTIVFVIIDLIDFIYSTQLFTGDNILDRLFFTYYLLIVSTTLLSSIKVFLHNKHEQQNKFIILGLILWLSGILGLINPFTNTELNAGLSLSLSASVVIVSYIIIHYYTLNSGYVVRKGMIYSVLTLLMALIAIIANWIEEQFPFLITTKYGILAIIAISFIIVLSFKNLQDYLIKFTNKLFKYEVFDYQQVLNEISQAITSSIEYDKILALINDFSTKTIGISEVFLIGYNQEQYTFFEIGKIEPWLLKLNDPLILLLKKLQAPITLTDLINWQNSAEIQKTLRSISITANDLQLVISELTLKSISVVLPFISKQRLIGFLATGKKKSQETYTKEDINFLNNLANRVATAMENTILYQELKKSEKIIRDQNEKIRSVIDNLTDGLIVIDQQQNIILANPVAESLFPEHKLIGQILPTILNQNISAEMPITAFPVVSEALLENKDNKITIKITTTPLLNQNQRLIGYTKIIHNITREKEIDKIKSDFIRTAAHKLRTPLSATKWILKMMVDGDMGAVTPEQKEFLIKGYKSNERIITVINDLLNVSEIEEGKTTFSFEKIQITDIINNVLKELEPLIKEKGHKLNYNQDRYIPRVIVDQIKITSIIKALVTNAIQYTLKGGEINIKVENLGKEVKITITDNGVGVPLYQQNKLFTKFMRGDNIIKKETEGNGLNLFIAKNVIEAHHGNISFEPAEENKGSIFSISLPQVRE